MDKLKALFTAHKTTVILILVLGILGVLGWFGFQKFAVKDTGIIEEVDLPFDAEGPYALLYPRRDGNALILNLKRTSSYDAITYELAYTSDPDETSVMGTKVIDDGEGERVSGSIDRGVRGDIDTKEKKGEYEQEILFGSCSKNVCKYDKGVENGTLTLHIRKGKKVYRMNTQWHLQQPDIALGRLTSGDEHLVYRLDGDRQTLSNIGFTILNDLTGVPKLPSGKQVTGKVYSLNAPIAKETEAGAVSIELADNPPSDAKLYRYNLNKSEWQELDTKVDGSKLSAKAEGAGIFAVLFSK